MPSPVGEAYLLKLRVEELEFLVASLFRKVDLLRDQVKDLQKD